MDYGCFAPVNAFALAFQKFGVNPTVEEIRAPMGMLKRDHIRTMLAMPAIQRQWQENQGAADEAAVEKIYGVFEDSLMESLADYAAPKPGVVETVEALRAQGISIGSTTGYTDQMMAVVTREAARQGYAPDAWFSPDSVQGLGRPYPYMIYANMAQFQVPSVADVVKVGDTVADIQEGKNAGIPSLGVLEGSSVLGLTREEFAELADISAGYYGQIEVGTSQMSIDTLIKLSKTSQLSMEYILLGEEIQPDADLTAIEALLARCTPREVRLAEKVLRLFLLRGDA